MTQRRVLSRFFNHCNLISRHKHRESSQSSVNDKFWDEEGSTEFVVSFEKSEPLKKYHELVNPKKTELDVLPNTTEKVHITKFGSIRLDGENIPVEESSQTPTVSSEKIEEHPNYVDEQYFLPLVKPELKLENQPKASNASQSELRDKSLNFFDKSYFSPSDSDSPASSSKEAKSYVTPEKLVDDLNPIDQEYLFPHSGKPESTLPVELSETEQSKSESEVKEAEPPRKKSALDYLENLRKESQSPKTETGGDTEAWKIYQKFLPNYASMFDDLIVSMLKKRVVYREGDIIAIDKPFGMSTMDSDSSPESKKHNPSLIKFLPALAEALKLPPGEVLRPIHRLDRDTTGVLLLATTAEMAGILQKMFYNRDVTKVYWALIKGVPQPPQGIVDIPMAESTIDGRQRMNLRPIIPNRPITRTHTHKAITNYQILRNTNSISLVELRPETGVKHQLRAHLSLGLSCPVLGDHKYSHRDRFAPQKLPDDVLQKLHFKQSKVRNIPMHLHAGYVVLPPWKDTEESVKISAPVPDFFTWTMKRLKLSYKLT